MFDKLVLYALAPLTFMGSLLDARTPSDEPMKSYGAATAETGGGLRIERASDGLFYVPVKVSGHTLHMALDTGATRSVLPHGLLASEKYRRLPRGGTIETLNGRVRYEAAILDDVIVGSKHFQQIEVSMADIAFPAPLLGQDLLRQLGPVTIDGDVLILR